MPRLSPQKFIARASGDQLGRTGIAAMNRDIRAARESRKLIPANLQFKKIIFKDLDQLVQLVAENGGEIEDLEQFEDTLKVTDTLHNI